MRWISVLSPRAKWLLLLSAIVVASYILYRMLHGEWYLFALRHGYPPQDFVTVRRLLDKAERGLPLSPHEFEALKRYAHHERWSIRVRVLTTFWFLAETPYAPEARRIAHQLIADPEWVVRGYALRALYYLRDPQVEEIARQRLSDPQEHERVRERAWDILGKIQEERKEEGE